MSDENHGVIFQALFGPEKKPLSADEIAEAACAKDPSLKKRIAKLRAKGERIMWYEDGDYEVYDGSD